MRTILLALFAFGCGEVHFIEPNPPRLFRNRPIFTSASVSEPLVWVAVLNLFIQETGGCAPAREATLATLRDAISRSGTTQIELPAQDLAPDCRQRGEKALDAVALQSAAAAAQQALPGAHVRPLVIYIDDIDLPLANDVPAAIANARSATGTLLWTISFESVSNQLRADRRIDWTYAGDAALADRLNQAVKADLPLQTTASPTSGPIPLLDASQLETTREFRVCAVPPGAVADSYPEMRTTHLLDRAHPPTITFELPQLVAMPKTSFNNSSFEALVEGCTGNCDRYFIREPGDDPFKWDEMRSCALGNR
jgi:hypothetical protein